MNRSLNLLLTVVGAFAVLVAAAVSFAAIIDSSEATTSANNVYAVETLPVPMPATPASTVYFDGINVSAIAVGAYE